MSSESTDDGGVRVELAADMDEWLTERAEALGVPREAVVEQLLASYKATADFDDETAAVGVSRDELDAVVAATVDEKLNGELDSAADDALQSRLPDIVDGVEERLDDRIDDLQADFQGKIEDVRERVVQVKRETDGKAPADHNHEEFDRLDALGQEVDGLDRELAELRSDLTVGLETQEAAVEDVDERLSDLQDKLTRVAWVVSDLREDQGGRDAAQRAVDRLKRAAAQEGISAARCEGCDEQVQIGLLTEPNCPHCNATVSDVRPEGGIFRTKARLVTAAQLESGATDD
ncbi:hypothetical protein [Haloarcula salina]|uniref:CopG family transcriptional regulator n=1 Tax=Haloarcula salina TaxID=1429914 RepID=A0AA41KGJ6_9EURY|nr:hypothetical protein [Haloarcula salina]MBV0900746.1 hypothetical protein [Haloarcula salina]